MDFFEKLTKGSGGYIFLSHSHEDIEKVRMIRDMLEKAGFEPLCFYLKCLRSADEVEDLIKREIDAREWFIFLDSENARRSKWVTMEREYVMKSDRRKIITVDLADEASIRSAMEKMLHDLRIYFSYSAKDQQLARRIKNRLEEKDYLVYFPPDSIPVDVSSFEAEITNAISGAARDGCVIALLTETFVRSFHCKKELMLALEQKGNIIPVLIGDTVLDDTLTFLLGRLQTYHLSEDPSDAEIDQMIDTIGRAIEKR